MLHHSMRLDMEHAAQSRTIPATALFDRLAMMFGTHPDLLRRLLTDTRECEAEVRAHFTALRQPDFVGTAEVNAAVEA